MKIKLDENAIMPTRAHSTDAGLDLYSPVDFWIEPEGSPIGDNCAVIDTGVHVELPKGTVGMHSGKSSCCNFKRDYKQGRVRRTCLLP